MIPGRAVKAIYGYCHIKNFDITTEVLKEKCMVFVNQVASIVHNTVDLHLGSANKNLGDAFLLVWRLDLYDAKLHPKIADMSVLSFIQIIVAINRDYELSEYREHPALVAHCSGSYRVTVNFGLHLGYSIEGAIGSQFKFDASYLSTHVNLALQLESLLMYYGGLILVSESLVRSCSLKGINTFCFRALDRVLMAGAKAPIRVFTIDLDTEADSLSLSMQSQRKGTKRTTRSNNQEIKAKKLKDNYEPSYVFSTDTHIQRMRSIFKLEFFQKFERGYLNYEAGEWDVAEQVLRETRSMLLSGRIHYIDGPSHALIEYMRSFNFKAPASWSGFRKDTEVSSFPLVTVLQPSTMISPDCNRQLKGNKLQLARARRHSVEDPGLHCI